MHTRSTRTRTQNTRIINIKTDDTEKRTLIGFGTVIGEPDGTEQ